MHKKFYLGFSSRSFKTVVFAKGIKKILSIIDVDETSVDNKMSSNSNYRKPEVGFLRSAVGK